MAKSAGRKAGYVPVSAYNTHMEITLTELEDAINYWRSVRPASGEERALSPEVDTLACVYATMIFHRLKSMRLDEVDDQARQLLGAWRARRA